jgi:hypothetical protein
MYNTGTVKEILFRNIAFANVYDAYILIGDSKSNSGTGE